MSKRKIPAITKNLKEITVKLYAAIALKQTIEPIVAENELKVLKQIKPVSIYDSQVITERKLTYHMSDEVFKDYHLRVSILNAKSGFRFKKDECPLLVAENQVRILRNDFLEAANYLVPTVDITAITKLENIDKVIDLTLNLIEASCANDPVFNQMKDSVRAAVSV